MILEDCGHDMDVDQPERTAGEIVRFYDKHWNAERIRKDQDHNMYRKYPNYSNDHKNRLSVGDINGIVFSSDL